MYQQHCEPPNQRSRAHYADVERLLQTTHEGFARLYVRSQPVRCFGLRRTLARLESGRIRQRTHRQLSARAWSLADSFGWAKTYDAEYVALAMLSGCRLVTTDDRLRRATEKLGFVVSPSEVRRG